MFAFLLLLFVLLVIYSFTTATKEGFNPMNTSPSHVVNIPVNKIPSMLPSPPASMSAEVSNTVSTPAQNGSIFNNLSVEPSTLPGQLPHAPYQQIAVASPLPYQDTTLIKANRQQLINLLELLKGFLAFEAQEIAERSDPTIQLPLQTARSDFHTLQSEVEVLNRNPGIQPTITLSHLNEISSNLAFLQREVRLIGTAGPIQGPIYQFTKPVEGFVAATATAAQTALQVAALQAAANPDMYQRSAERNAEKSAQAEARRKATVRAVSQSNNGVSASDLNAEFEAQRSKAGMPYETRQPAQTKQSIQSTQTRQPKQTRQSNPPLSELAAANDAAPSVVPGRSAQSTPATMQRDTPTRNRDDDNGGRATVQDLKRFVGNIDGELMRLSASGTTDPIMKAREVALSEIKSEIITLLEKIKEGRISESEIPVTKAVLERAFPNLSKPSEPLPQIIKATGLPPGLANLLPSNMQNDPETTNEINRLIDKYMDTIVNGISASFEVKYTSPFEAMKGYGAMMQPSTMQPSMMQPSTIDITGFPSMSDLDNISNAKFTPMDSGIPVTDPMAPTPSDAGRGPSRFDWEARSKQIEQQVKKRGLKASDYGIMPPQTRVSEGFSWKGYARMMCTRLQATMDPSLAVTCGCPPLDWSGWRIAK
jgi:hypothetical protein